MRNTYRNYRKTLMLGHRICFDLYAAQRKADWD